MSTFTYADAESVVYDLIPALSDMVAMYDDERLNMILGKMLDIHGMWLLTDVEMDMDMEDEDETPSTIAIQQFGRAMQLVSVGMFAQELLAEFERDEFKLMRQEARHMMDLFNMCAEPLDAACTACIELLKVETGIEMPTYDDIDLDEDDLS